MKPSRKREGWVGIQFSRKERNLYLALRDRRSRGVKERILAFGKLQLLLLGSRLHFPSENRKSCSPAKGGFTPSKRSAGTPPV